MAEDSSQIPIEIAASKLLEWLISRHHCTKDWPEKIEFVRHKINDALQDMPQSEVLRKILLEASPLNYYHCLKIVEILKETEADSKNIFGMYGSRRMKDWLEIVKLYQKDNLYLAEGGSIVGRTAVYEIPSLKRVMSKLEQRQADCLKNEATYKKQAQEYRDKFSHGCAQLGLTFDNFNVKTTANASLPSVNSIGLQLVNLMSQKLVDIFENISRQSKSVEPALTFYRKFLKVTVGLSAEDENCCGLLDIIIRKGNVTTYEWLNKEPPIRIEPTKLDYSIGEDEVGTSADGEHGIDFSTTEIDFGDMSITEDFNDGDVQLEPGEINWGEVDEEVVASEIDFAIDTEMPSNTAGIVLEEDGMDGGVARGQDALSILENPRTRSEFIDNLYELQGFLGQRIDETKNERNNDMMFSEHEDSLREDNLESFLIQITDVLSIFSETATKQYLLIRESKFYITRLAESLLQNLKLANKLEYQTNESGHLRSELGEEIKQIHPKVQLFSKQCRELQNELAKELSRKYNSRNVIVTGGV